MSKNNALSSGTFQPLAAISIKNRLSILAFLVIAGFAVFGSVYLYYSHKTDQAFADNNDFAKTAKAVLDTQISLLGLRAIENRFLAEKKGRELRSLILGAGSLSSLARVRPYAEKTTLVEIDPLVVESARRYWSEVNLGAGDHPNEEIVIDDARHYLMTHEEQYDLIIMDISAPYYLGTMLLHNRDFFRLVRQRLKSDGLFSESTQSRPRPWAHDATSMRILRSVDAVFPYWNLIATGGRARGNHGYVYAGKRDMTSTRTLIRYLEEEGYREGSEVYSHESREFALQNVEPFTLKNMNALLASNYYRTADLLGLEDPRNSDLGDALREMLARMRPHFGSWRLFLALLLAPPLAGWIVRRRAGEAQSAGSSLFMSAGRAKSGFADRERYSSETPGE